MSSRRGINPGANTAQQQQAAQPQSIGSNSSGQRIGRQVTKAEPPPPPEPSRIVTEDVRPASVIFSPNGTPVAGEAGFRRGLIGADGMPTSMQGSPEECTELCTRCDKKVPPKAMVTIIANAERGDNPLKICAGCAQQTYKNPQPGSTEKWSPSMPGVRFDRETGKPYDTRKAGVDMAFVLNKDTFRSREDDERIQRERSDVKLRDGHLAGSWSGGGRIGRRG